MSTHQGLSFLNPRPPLDAAAETIRQMEARALDFWADVVMPLVPKEEEGMCRTIAIISHGAFCTSYSCSSSRADPSLGRPTTDSLFISTNNPIVKALLIHLAHPSIGYLSFAKGVKPSSLPNTSVTTVRILSGMAEGICEVWGGVGHIVADEGDKVIVVGDLSGGE
jgi:broad specificity phosphatase PhoE